MNDEQEHRADTRSGTRPWTPPRLSELSDVYPEGAGGTTADAGALTTAAS
jgi:hypothetical protein